GVSAAWGSASFYREAECRRLELRFVLTPGAGTASDTARKLGWCHWQVQLFRPTFAKLEHSADFGVAMVNLSDAGLPCGPP
ncbi:hypothetical protein ACC686_36075, partial [Rhizobium johnstonii]|uniref:hypothetical protein n=1 Tax=Rhizobium johnstonii TaxID=3019933 RepID=UPI003F9A5481